MSKKPKQSRHRVPTDYVRPADPIDEQYQAEIDRSITRLTKRYAAAEKHLAALEKRAERARIHAEQLADTQARQQIVAANRVENERLLSERIATIKEAAKNQRVEAARAKLLAQHDATVRERNRVTEERKAQAKAARLREEQIRKSRRTFTDLQVEIEERRRELREIERLMMPGSYNNRDSKKGSARHETGRS